MPNPRYISRNGEPSVELLQKLREGRMVFESNLPWFCQRHGFNLNEIKKVNGVYLVGSHASERDWHNDTSDIDFALVVPDALPENLHRYKREVLDRLLHVGEKRRWIDLYFLREDYQVTDPRVELTPYWDKVIDTQSE